MIINLTLFFTFGVSLSDWAKTGLLQREVRIYQDLIKDHQISVTFVTYGDVTDRQFEKDLGGIKIIPIFERIYRPTSSLLALIFSLFIPWIYRKDLRQTDIFTTNQQWGSWIAVLSSWIFDKPLLLRCGYEPYRNSCHEKGRGLRHLFLKIVSLIAYKQATAISLPTQDIAEFVSKTFSISLDKINIVPNWIDSLLFSPDNNEKKYHNRVLTVGRLSGEKNIPLILQALSGTNISLDIIGEGTQHNFLQDHARDLCTSVNFIGTIANDKMPMLYKKYSIFVLCSKYEGNPKALLEAMACSCAVIGTAVPGIRELIGHGETGLLVPTNSSAVRDAILLLLGDSELRDNLGRNARAFVMDNHSLKDSIRIQRTIYQNLLRAQDVKDNAK